HATQIRDGKLGLLRVDEREPHLLRFAKKAVASPSISTSIFSRAFSLRRVFSSSSSSGLIPVFCWASSSFFHLARRLVPRPNSRATWVMVLPLLRTSVTASRLNSVLNRRFFTMHLILAGHCLKEVSTEAGQAHVPRARARPRSAGHALG